MLPQFSRVQQNSSGGFVSPRKRISTTSNSTTDDYSGNTHAMTNDDSTTSEASDIIDFDAFALSPAKKIPIDDPFSPFDFSTANFGPNTTFFVPPSSTTKKQQKLDRTMDNPEPKDTSFGSGDHMNTTGNFGFFAAFPQEKSPTAILEDDSIKDDEEDFFSPKPLSRKQSSSMSRHSHTDTGSNHHATHPHDTQQDLTTFTSQTATGVRPCDQRAVSTTLSSSSSNRGRQRPSSSSTREEGNSNKNHGEDHQPPLSKSSGEERSRSRSRKVHRNSSRKSSNEKDEPPKNASSRSQRSHSLGKRATTKLSASKSTKSRRSSHMEECTTPCSAISNSRENKISSNASRPALTRATRSSHMEESTTPCSAFSTSHENKIAVNGPRPALTRATSFSDRKYRRSILTSKLPTTNETSDLKEYKQEQRQRGRALENNHDDNKECDRDHHRQRSSSRKQTTRSHSESRRTALSTKMSSSNQRRSSAKDSSALVDKSCNNHDRRTSRRPSSTVESAAPDDGNDLGLLSPVTRDSHRQDRRSVGRHHSDLGKAVVDDGRRPSRRITYTKDPNTPSEDGSDIRSPASKDSGSHSGRRSSRFLAPRRTSSLVAAGLALPGDAMECEPFTLIRTNSFKQSRGSVRACRRSILKEDTFGSPRATTDAKKQSNRRLSSSTHHSTLVASGLASPSFSSKSSSVLATNRRLGGSTHVSSLANFTDASNFTAPGLTSPTVSSKSPSGLIATRRPMLERIPPAPSHSDSSAMRRREFDPRLDGLLQKLRDPSARDLNPDDDEEDDDDDITAQGVPVDQRGVFTRIAPMRHKSFTGV